MNCMRANDQGIIRFKFKYGVEFIEKGAKIDITNSKCTTTIFEKPTTSKYSVFLNNSKIEL